MQRLSGTVIFSACLSTIGCGGNVVVDPGGGGAGASVSSSSQSSSGGNGSTGSAGISCGKVSFDFAEPIHQCTAQLGICSIEGVLADGRSLRETCKLVGTHPACSLFVDGAQICDCPNDRLDFNELCANGLPTCDGWLVDYANIQGCP